MDGAFQILAVDWGARRADLLAVRREVFVVEQGVPEEMEVDEHDPGALHFLAVATAAGPVGAARLLPCGRVGRVAVLAPWRRRGVGRGLMRTVMEAAERRGEREIRLHAQDHSIPFYESLGFAARGPFFEEAGIPHREMRLALPAAD